MRVSPIELERENEKLRAQVAERDAAIADRDAKIAKLASDLAKVETLVKQLLANRRGGGYQIPEGQGLLFPQVVSPIDAPKANVPSDGEGNEVDGDDSDEVDSPRRPLDKNGKKRTPRRIDTTGLLCEDRVHDVPEDQRVDPVTGKPFVKIGEKVFEELDYTRAQLKVIRHRQPIYGLPPAEAEHRELAPVMADLPPRPLENCAASATLLAWLLVQKYANHLPLYRQEQIFGRDGLRLPRQTLCDWVLAAAEAMKPIVTCLMTQIRTGPVMQLDDTPVMCQGGRGQPNFQAYLWTFVNPQVKGVVYRFTAGRASDLIAEHLGDFHGVLVGDGYSGNRAAADKVAGKIVHGGCWAHVTRKFRDAGKEAPGTAGLFRDDIRKLYVVEREADEAQLDREARMALRRQKSRPILAAIFSRTRRMQSQFSDAGIMAKALGYVRNQRKALRQFLREGLAPIDNNACERSIRPIAIGRRNRWVSR